MKILLDRWHVLASAPHRLFFLGGVCQGIVAVIWWYLELWQHFGASEPFLVWTIPGVWAHAYFMIYGFFPFFIFGFLFTFFPNWLNVERISLPVYMASFMAMSSGTILFYIGLIWSKTILFLALLIVTFGWGIGTLALIRVLIRIPSSEKTHLVLIICFVTTGGLGLVHFILWLLLNNPALLSISLITGVWCFLLPLVVTISHLVIPFFSKAVIKNYQAVQPLLILWILLAAMFLRGLLEGMAMAGWFWIPDLLIIIFASYLSLVWQIQASIVEKMLFILHLSFIWLSIGSALDLIQSLILVLSQGRLFVLGHAPLHALTLGLFGSMVIGISTRVTFGHSDIKVSPDRSTWRIFLIFQAAVVLRVLADFSQPGSQLSVAAYEGSALLWIGVFSLWFLKYGYLLWQPSSAQRF